MFFFADINHYLVALQETCWVVNTTHSVPFRWTCSVVSFPPFVSLRSIRLSNVNIVTLVCHFLLSILWSCLVPNILYFCLPIWMLHTPCWSMSEQVWHSSLAQSRRSHTSSCHLRFVWYSFCSLFAFKGIPLYIEYSVHPVKRADFIHWLPFFEQQELP